jgi:hypothetical protein
MGPSQQTYDILHSVEEFKTNIKDAISNIDHNTLSGGRQQGETKGCQHSGERQPVSTYVVTE